MALGLFAACAAGAAVVYKWTDSSGVVHFSDQPVPGAEKIITSSGTSNGIGGQASAPSTASAPSVKPPPGGLIYTELSIDSPAKEQVFFGADTVSVHLHLTPGLRQNHTVTWHLNGQQLDDQAGAVAFTLQPMPRGTYAITATVSDPATGESRSTDSVTFYVRQPSALSPQHK
jgi:hypothetical protein